MQGQQGSWSPDDSNFTTTCRLVLLHASMTSIASVSAREAGKLAEVWVRAFLECIEGLFSSAVTDMKAGSLQATELQSILSLLSLDR